MSFTRRFNIESRPIGGWDNPDFDHDTTPFETVVLDRGSVIWRKETGLKGNNPDEWDANAIVCIKAHDEATAWFNEHYPDWEKLPSIGINSDATPQG